MSDNEQIKFPEITDVEMIFSAKIPEREKFEKLAKEHGFEYGKNNKFINYAMEIFYCGDKYPPKKEGVSPEYYNKGMRYFKCWIGSFEPKHERKEEVCGFIVSLISDLKEHRSFKDKIKTAIKKMKGDKNAQRN